MVLLYQKPFRKQSTKSTRVRGRWASLELRAEGFSKVSTAPPPYPLQFGPDNKRYEYYAALRARPAGAAPDGGAYILNSSDPKDYPSRSLAARTKAGSLTILRTSSREQLRRT